MQSKCPDFAHVQDDVNPQSAPIWRHFFAWHGPDNVHNGNSCWNMFIYLFFFFFFFFFCCCCCCCCCCFPTCFDDSKMPYKLVFGLMNFILLKKIWQVKCHFFYHIWDLLTFWKWIFFFYFIYFFFFFFFFGGVEGRRVILCVCVCVCVCVCLCVSVCAASGAEAAKPRQDSTYHISTIRFPVTTGLITI